MVEYAALIEVEGTKFYSRKEGRYIEVKTSFIKSENFEGRYESAKINFICPFTGKNVSLEIGLANHGKSKAIKRVCGTINNYLGKEEERVREERYNSVLNRNFRD